MRIIYFIAAGIFALALELKTDSFTEIFRNCADVAITSNTGGIPPLFIGKNNPFLLYYRDYRAPDDDNLFPLIVR